MSESMPLPPLAAASQRPTGDIAADPSHVSQAPVEDRWS
jgi:hypothetical protein